MNTATAEAIGRINTYEHQGIIEADRFLDRASIESEATELLADRARFTQPEVGAQEYKDNGRTAIMEALTASGHLSRVTISGSLEEIESQMIGRLLNGWDDRLPQHEKDRRFAELVNVLYGKRIRAAIVAGALPEDTAILEISDYPEPLAGTKLGYRDKNKKGMIRSTHLEKRGEDSYELVIDQISRANTSDNSTFAFMEGCGVRPLKSGKPADLVALETPMLYSLYDYVDGAVDMARRLDAHAGAGVLYGDTGAAKARHVPYEQLRQESARREDEIECFTDDLAKLESQLSDYVRRGQMTYAERTVIFNEEVQRILAAICTLEPAYAADTFGEKVAPSFYEASIAVARGNTAEAERILKANVRLRESVNFCGSTISLEDAEEDGLLVNSYGKLVRKGREGWNWKEGVCVVKSCPTRPGKTKVGPCSVCLKCQAKFDNGEDPAKKAALGTNRERDARSGHIIRGRVGQALLKPLVERRRGDH